jgi:prefoldin subunit 5
LVPDYQREFENERRRLAQLWDAYEEQDREVQRLQKRVDELEETLRDKDDTIATLKGVMDIQNIELDRLRKRLGD